jgi:hypothetical protein
LFSEVFAAVLDGRFWARDLRWEHIGSVNNRFSAHHSMKD